MSTITWSCPADGRQVEPQPSWMAFTGQTADEVRGAGWLHAIHADDAAAVAARWTDAVAAGARFSSEHRIRRHDGEWRWMNVTAVPIPDEHGAIAEWFGACVDITERRVVELALRDRTRQLEVLARTGELLALSTSAADAAALQAVFELVSQALDAELCFYFRLGDEPGTLRLSGSVGVGEDDRRRYAVIRFGEYLCGQVAAERRRVVVEQMAQSDAAEAAALCALGVRSYAGYPLLAGGQLLGTLAFATKRRAAFRDGELHVLQSVADQVAALLARGRLGDEVQQREERIQQALRVSRSFTFEWDPRSDRVRRSASCADILHLAGDDAVNDTGRRFFARVHPDDRERFVGVVSALTPHAPAYETDYRVTGGDGRLVTLEETGRASFDADGVMTRMVGVTTDVTARKRTEEALRESERRLRAVLEQLPTGVGLMDREGRWMLSNPLMDALVPTAVPSVLPDRVSRWQAFDDSNEPIPPAQWPGQRALRGETVSPGLEMIYSDGERPPRWVRVSAAPLRDDADAIVGATCVVLDISLQKQTEHALRAASQSFRQLVEHSPFGIYAVDADFRLALVSAGAQKVFEHVRPLIGRDFEEVLRALWPEPFVSQALGQFRRTLATGETYRSPRTVEQRADTGATEAYDWRLDRVILPDGRLGVVCHFYDLSERQRYEETLRIARVRLETALDASQVILFRQDRELRYTWIHNPALGYGANDVLGKRDVDLMDRADDAARVDAIKRRVLESGESERAEVSVSRAGRSQHFDLVVQADRDGAGHVVGVNCAAVDVTARKETEAALATAAEQLRQADRRKDEFLATLAHELRNPLAPIRTALHIMELPGADAGVIDRCRAMMGRQVEHLVRLIDDLLDVSRITRGHIPLQTAPMRLSDAVRLAVDTSRPLIDAHGHVLELDVAAEPIDVDGDLTRLSQVFANLLNNAARYTDRGGRIRLTLARQAREAVVRVEDNGIGIPAPMLARVFDMFVQVDRGLERSQGGLGLGLHLAKRLVEMHGGTIVATSDGPGHGSAFEVRVPVAETPIATVRTLERGAAPFPTAGAGLRIMIVDDNRDAADSVAGMLELVGHVVHTAYDGREAIDTAERVLPEVVLLDLGMPELSGHDICQHLRRQPWGAQALMVAMTGWGQEEDRRRALEAGFDHHLVKPVDGHALVRLLAERSSSAGLGQRRAGLDDHRAGAEAAD